MDFQRQTVSHHEDVIVSYDKSKYMDIHRNRWDIWKNEPINSASELCYALRKIVNTDESRQTKLLELLEDHPKAIIFYNFDSAYGDFEIYTAIDDDMMSVFKDDYYLWSPDSEHTMIVEEREIVSDAETGNRLQVKGRSLESILLRRIVWEQSVLSGNLQNGIKKLLNENVISPTDEKRKISNFVFIESTDPVVTELTVDAQFTGDVLYDAIKALCDTHNIGFKVVLTEDGLFEFSLYAGVDRTYDQSKNPYVIFSPDFENIVNSNYLESKKKLKTVTLVAGEGEDPDRKTVTVEVEGGGGEGLNRREMYTDVRYVQSETSDGALTEEEYNAQLTQKGNESLAENVYIKAFEGQVETSRIFVYGEDFFMGDVVQVANEYGIESKSRVIELIRSEDENGIEVYPTFTVVA